MSTPTNWRLLTRDDLPPNGELVDTKIDDGKGVRNVQQLKRLDNLWFISSGEMYVYYTPTHWKEVQP